MQNRNLKTLGTDEKIQKSTKQTALDIAAEKKNLKALKTTINHLQSVNKSPTEQDLAACMAQAAMNGDEEMVAYLIKLGVNPNWVHAGSSPALHLAATGGHTRVVQILLAAGANIELISEKTGDTALCAAIKKNNFATTQLLLKKGANPNVTRKSIVTPTPLTMAVNDKFAAIFDLLLDHGANPNTIFPDKRPLPVRIAMQDCPAMMQSLIKRKFPINAADDEGKNALHYAAQFDDIDLMPMLCKADIDIHVRDKKGRSPLAIAISKDACGAANILIEHGANANEKVNGTPLLIQAVNDGYKEAVRVLIASDADLEARNEREETPLYRAVIRESLSLVKILLAAGADVNAVNKAENTTALDLAIEDEDTTTINLLLKFGAAVTDKVLKTTAFENKFDIFSLLYCHIHPDASHIVTVCAYIRLLLERGAPAKLIFSTLPKFENNKTIKSLDLALAFSTESPSFSAAVISDFSSTQRYAQKKRQTSLQKQVNLLLMRAIRRNDIHAAEEAIALGANVSHYHDVSRHRYYTPLHLAAKRGHASIISLLLKHNAEVNPDDDKKNTPLHKAAQYNHADALEQLIAAGARLDILNHHKESAAYVAAFYGQMEALKVLITHGADLTCTVKLSRSELAELASKSSTLVMEDIDDLLQDAAKQAFEFTAATIAELLHLHDIVYALKMIKPKQSTSKSTAVTQYKQSLFFYCTPQDEDIPLNCSHDCDDENEISNCNVPSV